MRIRTLHLTNFRNFGDARVEFSERRNVLLGANAEGKTNILDAVHMLGVGRSHRERREANLVKFGETYYRIEGVFDHIGVRTTIEIAYGPEGKRIRVNGKEARGSDLVGLAAVVITSPDDINLLKGGPVFRRRFLDIAISQMSRVYLRALQQFVRALAHRNVLLKNAREGGRRPDTAVWDRALLDSGAAVVALRLSFLKHLGPMVEAAFNRISGGEGRVELCYEPRGYTVSAGAGGPGGQAGGRPAGGPFPGGGSGSEPAAGPIAEAMGNALEKCRAGEAARGYSLVGPHVDDFRFVSGGLDLRQFGSEGEQRTAVLALRCGEARAIEEKLERAPIVLLDDVFAELDDRRAAALIALISGFDQIILTASRHSPLESEEVHRIHVEEGRVRYDG